MFVIVYAAFSHTLQPLFLREQAALLFLDSSQAVRSLFASQETYPTPAELKWGNLLLLPEKQQFPFTHLLRKQLE